MTWINWTPTSAADEPWADPLTLDTQTADWLEQQIVEVDCEACENGVVMIEFVETSLPAPCPTCRGESVTYALPNPAELERGELWELVGLESEAIMLERLLGVSGLSSEWEDVFQRGRV